MESKDKKYLLQEIWKEEKTEATEIQLTPIGYLCLVTSYGNSVESTTSVLEMQNKTGKCCFCLVDDLAFENSWNNQAIWKQEQMLVDHQLLCFLACYPIMFPEVLGNNIQIVPVTKCAPFMEQREGWVAGLDQQEDSELLWVKQR